MSAVDLMLPKHLYMAIHDSQGEVIDVIYFHDRLINWFDHGKGVNKLCKSVFDQDLDRIRRWEDTQMLQLEEQWLAVENGEDDEDSEAQYHLACEAVSQEADTRREKARNERSARHDQIITLLEECADHIDEHAPPPYISHAIEYTLTLTAIGTLAFVIL